MGTDVVPEVADHLVPMLKVLDGEENGHGKGQKADQSRYNLKTKALVKFYLSHRIG